MIAQSLISSAASTEIPPTALFGDDDFADFVAPPVVQPLVQPIQGTHSIASQIDVFEDLLPVLDDQQPSSNTPFDSIRDLTEISSEPVVFEPLAVRPVSTVSTHLNQSTVETVKPTSIEVDNLVNMITSMSTAPTKPLAQSQPESDDFDEFTDFVAVPIPAPSHTAINESNSNHSAIDPFANLALDDATAGLSPDFDEFSAATTSVISTPAAPAIVTPDLISQIKDIERRIEIELSSMPTKQSAELRNRFESLRYRFMAAHSS